MLLLDLCYEKVWAMTESYDFSTLLTIQCCLKHRGSLQQNLEKDIEQTDGFAYAHAQRPTTEWTVEALMCIRFDVFKL